MIRLAIALGAPEQQVCDVFGRSRYSSFEESLQIAPDGSCKDPEKISRGAAVLPEDVASALQSHGLPGDEVGLREALETRVPGWELFCLTPAAAKRWKCRYRLLMGAGYYDGQTAAEAYARALLVSLESAANREPSERES